MPYAPPVERSSPPALPHACPLPDLLLGAPHLYYRSARCARMPPTCIITPPPHLVSSQARKKKRLAPPLPYLRQRQRHTAPTPAGCARQRGDGGRVAGRGRGSHGRSDQILNELLNINEQMFVSSPCPCSFISSHRVRPRRALVHEQPRVHERS